MLWLWVQFSWGFTVNALLLLSAVAVSFRNGPPLSWVGITVREDDIRLPAWIVAAVLVISVVDVFVLAAGVGEPVLGLWPLLIFISAVAIRFGTPLSVPIMALQTIVIGWAAANLLFEVGDLMGHYQRFRYAFPDRANPRLDSLAADYTTAITAALRDVPAITVAHPYPLAIPRLYDAIEPHLR